MLVETRLLCNSLPDRYMGSETHTKVLWECIMTL